MTMTDDEMRICIAEACSTSFKCCRCERQASLIKYAAPFCGESCAESASDYTLDTGQQRIPDYLSDLNAVREAEETVPNYANYVYFLADVIGCDVKDDPDSGDYWELLHATARQRAIAFLKTIGKLK